MRARYPLGKDLCLPPFCRRRMSAIGPSGESCTQPLTSVSCAHIAPRLAFWASTLVFALFLIAGVAKLAELDAFWWTLVREHGLSERISTPASILVPAGEVLVAGLWLAGLDRSRAALGGLVLLAVFSAYLGVQIATRAEPTCGCLGVLAEYARWMDSARVGIARNLLMMLPLGAWLWFGRATGAGSVS